MGVVVTTHGFVASVGWRAEVGISERGVWAAFEAGDKAAELSVGGVRMRA